MRMQSLILRLELKRDLNSSSSAPAELPVLGCTTDGQKWQIRGAQHCHWRCLLSGEAKFTSTSEMVKGFGCRQAYESPSCRNPRARL